MYSISSFFRRYSVVTFFALAFAISWALPMFFPVGPFVAAIVVAGLAEGLAGLKDLASRCLRWRVGLRWYAAALLVPVAIGAITVALTVLFGSSVPAAGQLGPWYSLLLMFPLALIDAPLFEETGWRGFAVPRFPTNRTRLANTLILGALLAAWHLPRALADTTITAPYLIATFTSAIVINWVYYNGRESALLAILYHTAANAMGLYFAPLFAGPDLATYFWILAAVNCVLAVVIVLVGGQSLGYRSTATAQDAQVLVRP